MKLNPIIIAALGIIFYAHAGSAQEITIQMQSGEARNFEQTNFGRLFPSLVRAIKKNILERKPNLKIYESSPADRCQQYWFWTTNRKDESLYRDRLALTMKDYSASERDACGLALVAETDSSGNLISRNDTAITRDFYTVVAFYSIRDRNSRVQDRAFVRVFVTQRVQLYSRSGQLLCEGNRLNALVSCFNGRFRGTYEGGSKKDPKISELEFSTIRASFENGDTLFVATNLSNEQIKKHFPAEID